MSVDLGLASQSAGVIRKTAAARFWGAARRRPLSAFLLALVALLIAIAIVAPSFTADPTEFNLDHQLASPSARFPFGTDEKGRDVLARSMSGLRTSLEVGALSAVFGVSTGLVIGLFAGYRRGWTDVLAQWVTNSFLAFPGLLLAMGATLALGRSVVVLSVSLALVTWPVSARVIRSAAITQGSAGYVESAVTAGASSMRILFRHILPNIVSLCIVLLTAAIAQNILIEAALSFLGVGIQPPQPSLGSMILAAQTFAARAPWLLLAPGATMAICVFSISLLGDILRDALDPRLRNG